MKRYTLLLTATAIIGFSLCVGVKQGHASGPDPVDNILKQAIAETASSPPVMLPAPVAEPLESTPSYDALPVLADPVTHTAPAAHKTGIRLGHFLLEPKLGISGGHDDNLHATDKNEISSFFTSLQPSMELSLQDTPHIFELRGDYEYRKFFDHSNENQHNVSASANGALRAAKWLTFPFTAFWKRHHEKREDDLVHSLSDEPIKTTTLGGMAGLELKQGRLALGLLGHYGQEEFKDGYSSTAAASVTRRHGDRKWMMGEPYLSVDLSDIHSLKLSGTIGRRDYDSRHFQAGGFTGPKRDSKTWSAMAGWHFAFTGLKGHLSAGYADYDYDDGAVNDMHAIIADGEINYDLTDMTTFNLQFGRNIYEDSQIINPATRTHIGAFLDHKLTDAFLVGAGAQYELLDFDHSTRKDKSWNLRAMADYLVTDHFSVGLEYIYSLRDSNTAGFDYDRNRIMVKARGRI